MWSLTKNKIRHNVSSIFVAFVRLLKIVRVIRTTNQTNQVTNSKSLNYIRSFSEEYIYIYYQSHVRSWDVTSVLRRMFSGRSDHVATKFQFKGIGFLLGGYRDGSRSETESAKRQGSQSVSLLPTPTSRRYKLQRLGPDLRPQPSKTNNVNSLKHTQRYFSSSGLL